MRLVGVVTCLFIQKNIVQGEVRCRGSLLWSETWRSFPRCLRSLGCGLWSVLMHIQCLSVPYYAYLCMVCACAFSCDRYMFACGYIYSCERVYVRVVRGVVRQARRALGFIGGSLRGCIGSRVSCVRRVHTSAQE
jgi:hypothetical protein